MSFRTFVPSQIPPFFSRHPLSREKEEKERKRRPLGGRKGFVGKKSLVSAELLFDGEDGAV